MRDLKKLALEVFEGREDAEKKIAKNNLATLEECVESIICIFKFSNILEKNKVLVWQVELYTVESSERIGIMISFKQSGEVFYNTGIFNRDGIYANNEVLKDFIDSLNIPRILYKDIYNYFKENLSEYFVVEKPDDSHIIIGLKAKS